MANHNTLTTVQMRTEGTDYVVDTTGAAHTVDIGISCTNTGSTTETLALGILWTLWIPS